MNISLLINEVGQIFISIGVVLVCIGLFICTYLLNKRTKKPDGCENLEENCSGCQLTQCSHHPNKKEQKGEENND